ncbi:hypothetical protein HPB48_023573 [Haemaphysalis longicornis]|uniref:YqaJ viral recombinase domain-containing protein n=1 Tax=Haemaphysalis longicornis TaxID=44386 RepID=A0A9J6H6F4_HAELO|nr:hypothetical protein HPB48_023573 [Haemaphysalis longicornis]
MKQYTRAKGRQLGLVVAPEVPWLGNSPDGVSSQGNRRVLIEVKCPMLGKEDSIVNLVHKKRCNFSMPMEKTSFSGKQNKYYSRCSWAAPSRNECVPFGCLLTCGSFALELPKDVQHMPELLGRLQYVYLKKVLQSLLRLTLASIQSPIYNDKVTYTTSNILFSCGAQRFVSITHGPHH